MKLNSKGQLTIPAELRRRLGFAEGDEVEALLPDPLHRLADGGNTMSERKLSARERNEKAVAEMVDTVMHDTRWDWMRTRRARLTIVGLMIALLIAVPVAWLTMPALAALGVIAVAAGAWWALRMSVRVVADLPEEYLDERQARVRDRAYVEAYRWFAGLTLIAATAALVWFVIMSEDDLVTFELTWGGAMALFWALEGLALTLPSIVLALREPDRT